MSGHDAHLAGLGNDTGAVSTDHSRLVLRLQSVVNPDLISLGDTLGDGDNQLDLVLDRLDDRIGGSRGGNVDDRRVGLGVLDGLGDRAKDGSREVLRAGFLGDVRMGPGRK